MASDIVTTLQLDKQLPSRVIIVKELNNCDSSFITSCILSHCIKNKHAVFVLTTHNSASHYQNVLIKMNCNLLKHVELGLVKFYNLGQESVNSLLANKHISLENLLPKINEMILQMQEKYETVNIILDGITHLLDLHYTITEINRFFNGVVNISRKNNKSFVLCHCNVGSEDDISHTLANLLSHKADILLDVENLLSGWSADVSGHLTVKHISRKFDDEYIFNMDVKPSKYLFKLFDRGVKLFAPGTV